MRRLCPGHAASSAALLLLTTAIAVAGAAPALAHTSLSASVPAAGATVTTDVDAVRLVFSQPVSPREATVVVSSADGVDLADGPAQVSGATVVQPVDRLVGAGGYRLSYRVLADDGHPITGQVRFTLAAAVAGGPAPTQAPDPGPVSGPAPSPALAPRPGNGIVVPALMSVLVAAMAWLAVGAVRSVRRLRVEA